MMSCRSPEHPGDRVFNIGDQTMCDFEVGERVYSLGANQVLRWRVIGFAGDGEIAVAHKGIQTTLGIGSIFKSRMDAEAAISARPNNS